MSKDLPESECFVLLANRRRRLSLRLLYEFGAPLPLSEIADRIADRTCDRPSDEELRAIHVDLYHNHIPRLEDADVVSYDRDDGTVALRGNFDTLVRYLEQLSESDALWTDA